MPPRKRYSNTKGGKRRNAGRRSMIKNAMKAVYSYKQVVLNPTTLGPIGQTGGSGDYLAAYNFTLAQVGGNLGPFTSLYDQYKIKKIVWQLVPKFNGSDLQQGASLGGEQPMVVTCIDYDDSNNPANIGELMQRQNCKIQRAGKIITRTFRPSCNFVIDAATGGLSQKTSPWLDVQNITIPHYGLKLGIQGMPTGTEANFDVIVKYYLAFKQVR